jgi:exopolyphosphatase/guanosine-5'-triphosphate,3'-diphosphate pyrophosphatase
MAEFSDPPTELAALDLGSNSFHLIVARQQNGRLQVIDRLKEMVRLAGGIDANGNLSQAAMERALAALSRIAQRLRPLHEDNVRVVGTNTLRRARNAREFVVRAEAVLGHRIEVVSGREEARLIYAGVCHALSPSGERRLVIDIGGGSTELILGRDRVPEIMESLHMGCVSFSERFFPDARLRPRRFDAAVLAAQQELEPLETQFLGHGWDIAIGASGTVIAIRDLATSLGLSTNNIDANSLPELRRAMLEHAETSQLAALGLPAERAPVFPGGLAILTALMATFRLKRVQVSDGALREGVLLDLLGRAQDHDQRDVTIDDLARRYHVDTAHAQRVRRTALRLLAAVADRWELDDPEWNKLLGWAALVHEIGTDIAHSQYHKHGHYLLVNMDLAGFSRDDQRRLALLVRSHRRKFPVAEFMAVPESERKLLMRLSALLRIAVVLHRNRTEDPLPTIDLTVKGSELRLTIDPQWLATHPLTCLDLEQEQLFLDSVPLRLAVAGLVPIAASTD